MRWLKRLFKMSVVWGAWNTLLWARRRVRVHPYARIEASRASVSIRRGTKIGPGSIISAGKGATITIGQHCWFNCNVELRTEGILDIGNNVSLQKEVTLNGNVKIGAGCIFAPRVFASSGTHIFNYVPEIPIREQEKILFSRQKTEQVVAEVDQYDQPIEIGEDCWIGINAVILPGVVIGRGSIIGANAVITKSIEPYSIVAGVPAKRIGFRLSWIPPDSLDATQVESIPYLYEGFEVSINNGRVLAYLSNRVVLALHKADANLLALTIEATEKGIVRCGTSEVVIKAGKMSVSLAVANLPHASQTKCQLYELFSTFESSTVRARLLDCKLTTD